MSIHATSSKGQVAAMTALSRIEVRRLAIPALQRAGVDISSLLREEAPVDTGNLRRSHGYAVARDGSSLLLFSRSKYSIYVHQGRKPGKRPPVAALIPWCRRHIMNARITSQLIAGAANGVTPRVRKSATKTELQRAREMAFLVARAIGRRGVKANPWFLRTMGGRGGARVDRLGAEITKVVDANILSTAAAAIVDGVNRGATK